MFDLIPKQKRVKKGTEGGYSRNFTKGVLNTDMLLKTLNAVALTKNLNGKFVAASGEGIYEKVPNPREKRALNLEKEQRISAIGTMLGIAICAVRGKHKQFIDARVRNDPALLRKVILKTLSGTVGLARTKLFEGRYILIVLVNDAGDPTHFNLIPFNTLLARKKVSYKIYKSDPTAVHVDVSDYPPIHPFFGGKVGKLEFFGEYEGCAETLLGLLPEEGPKKKKLKEPKQKKPRKPRKKANSSKSKQNSGAVE